MNKQRRAAITKLQEKLDELRTELETILDEEQEAFDNMPESLQNGERGEKAEKVITSLEDAMSNLDDVGEYLQSAKE